MVKDRVGYEHPILSRVGSMPVVALRRNRFKHPADAGQCACGRGFLVEQVAAMRVG